MYSGILDFSFKERYENVIWTRIDTKENMKYVLKLEYYGNPLSKDSSLVFTEFGWEILDVLRKCGYRDAYAITCFSVKKGYVDLHMVFEAIIKKLMKCNMSQLLLMIIQMKN